MEFFFKKRETLCDCASEALFFPPLNHEALQADLNWPQANSAESFQDTSRTFFIRTPTIAKIPAPPTQVTPAGAAKPGEFTDLARRGQNVSRLKAAKWEGRENEINKSIWAAAAGQEKETGEAESPTTTFHRRL